MTTFGLVTPKKVVIHILQYFFMKLPLQLFGAIFLIYVTKKYSLGRFPVWARWFDDHKGRYMAGNRLRYLTINACAADFGMGHCELFREYNRTWLKRYIWSAWRNSCNVFQHDVLGKPHFTPDLWLIKNDGFFRVRMGYKLGDSVQYRDARYKMGLPAQWVLSLGIRLKKD